MDDEDITPIAQAAVEQLQAQLQADLGPQYYLSQYAVFNIRHTLYNELKSYKRTLGD